MNGNNNDQALDNGLLMELLRQGLIVGSVSAAGTFLLGGISGIVGSALGVILALINRGHIATAQERINALADNAIVKILLTLLLRLCPNMSWERIWQGLVRVVNFLSSFSRSGSAPMIMNH